MTTDTEPKYVHQTPLAGEITDGRFVKHDITETEIAAIGAAFIFIHVKSRGSQGKIYRALNDLAATDWAEVRQKVAPDDQHALTVQVAEKYKEFDDLAKELQNTAARIYVLGLISSLKSMDFTNPTTGPTEFMKFAAHFPTIKDFVPLLINFSTRP